MLGRRRDRLGDESPGVVALAYSVALVGYLWLVQENDLGHWLSMVLAPFAGVVLESKARRRRPLVRESFASVGLRRSRWRAGLGFAIVVGVAASVAQLLVSDQRAEIWDVVRTGRVLVYLPLVLVLLVLTAAFTEELFFRGVLLTRLADWWHSEVAALVVSAALFGLYHFPYAYLDPEWSTHGDAVAALTECGWAALAGLLLGYVFLRSDRNLVASVVSHALLDALPAMTMVHFAIHVGG
jgi:membrane protease YdiL (CAAX protease family)